MVSTVALASGPERERSLRNKDRRADMRISVQQLPVKTSPSPALFRRPANNP